MANEPNDNVQFYEYLVDEPEMMASTPLSPHFSPSMFGGAFDVRVRDRPHHATRPGNQPMSSPGHNRPDLMDETVECATTNPIKGIAEVPGPATAQAQAQQQHHHQVQAPNLQSLHHPALGGLTELHLTAGAAAVENQGAHQHHHHHHHQQPDQFAAAPFADHQGLPALLHAQQGHLQAPATWFPPGYGAPSYYGNHQQAAAATVSSSSSTAAVTAANPPVTISAAGGLINGNTGVFDFGFAAPPLSEQSFLGADYANITPLSTVAGAAVTAHSQPTTAFGFHSSPWRPTLQDSSSVTLTPNIAAIAAAELNHDVRKPSKGSMEDDSDVNDRSWGDGDDDDKDNGNQKRGGKAGLSSSTSPRPRRHHQQRNGKRRAVANSAGGGAGDDDDEPTSPAGRTSVSGRSVKSVSVASTTGSSSKTTAPAPRLRSASRTSKNASQKPAETAEERRTRASHNLVEKQYRNRLNAQFEGLLNALPEQVRGPAGTEGGGGGGGGGGDESDPQPADQERRVSKAEVLDMARRHIRSLEQERDELQRERGDLLRNLETLEREMAANGGGRLDEFLDVKGPPDERGESSWRDA